MLTATFCCFQGVSRSAEQRLWESDCLSWNEALVTCPKVFSEKKLESVRRQIRDAQVALEAGMADYFINRLPAPDTIRVLPHFKTNTAYLDIETTGLSHKDSITTIALYKSNGNLHCFIKGHNLIKILSELNSISLLITYNGKAFDLPRIRHEFGINLQVPHLDLLPCLNALGYRGGLKSCEKLLGIHNRSEGVSDGKEAVALWREYESSGDRKVLHDLIRYNLQDAINLEYLAFKVYNIVMAGFPLHVQLSNPDQPDISVYELDEAL